MEISGKATNADHTHMDIFGAQDLRSLLDFCTAMPSQSEWDSDHTSPTNSAGLRSP